MRNAIRGSAKHIIDWIEEKDFPESLTKLLVPSGAVVTRKDFWMPRSRADITEARLDRDGKKFIPGFDWGEIRKWWLSYPHPKSNTPNWDIATVCQIAEKPAMVLVEAKAHNREFLSSKSKKELSVTSTNNRLQIMRAIFEANDALATVFPGLDLLRDLRSGFAERVDLCSHYQLSNRVAFSWKLASMGLPVVLVYLGFVGDHGIADRRIEKEPLKNESHWRDVFTDYALPVLGSAFMKNILEEKPIDCGNASMTFLLRSRLVLEASPPSASQFLFFSKSDSG